MHQKLWDTKFSPSDTKMAPGDRATMICVLLDIAAVLFGIVKPECR